MSRNTETVPQETARNVLGYLKFAGFELTRDQLVRLYQRRLISLPINGPGGPGSPKTIYPPGTAERMVRIAQLKTGTKQLDELAWRLWWEGLSVEPSLIRDYLVKIASRWDERLGEIRRATASGTTEDGTPGERDILDEVFFRHLKLVPSMASVRKRLGKGSDIYVEFARLLINLLRGDFSILGEHQIELFSTNGKSAVNGANGFEDSSRATLDALEEMQGGAALPYATVVELLDDEEIESARLVALLFSRIIANIGVIMDDGYGGTGRGGDTVGKSLMVLSESPEEQVLSLLLTTSFLQDERIRENLPVFDSLLINTPAVSFLDFLRLTYLASEIPALRELIAPNQMREAFDSPEGAERWRARFEEFRLANESEIEAAKVRRPDLFDDPPPVEEEESPLEVEEIDDSKKKK
ncbi:MAG TPA: hypothetical protein VII84_02610 [Acidimicrobiales bacterium]